tara:strand:- start:852 stop:1505 length:654 start_codon:yes stop_codon:yes gene_type:complete
MDNKENNIDWFFELEKNTKELVSELENIKQSSVIYDDAKKSLSTISNELIHIAENISSLIESLKSNTTKSNETLIKSNELLSKQIKTNEQNLKEIDSSLTNSFKISTNTLTNSIKTSTNKSNKTLLQSNEILLEQIKTSEQSLKKIQSSFKKFQNEITNELEATKTFIHEDNYDLMTSIQNRINDKFEKFNIRFVIGFTIVVVMTVFSMISPHLNFT